MLRTKSKPTKRTHKTAKRPKTLPGSKKVPFIEHIYELRKRLFFIALAVIAGGGAAYGVQMQITDILLKPAGSQQFIYTSPGGGFDFLFRLCMYSGILVAIPVIVWQLLRYIQPLMKQGALRFIAWGSVVSGLLAVVGIVFGYFVGLPAAMKFLLHGFNSTHIEALITIQSYMSFVLVYLIGSALLFQVPLVMILINRIKPLQPRKLMKFQRWFIVLAFIVGAVINPSPTIQDQLMLSVPMILMYQLGIIIIWITNRSYRKAQKLAILRQKDEAARAERHAQFQQAQDQWVANVGRHTGTVARSAPTMRTWHEPPMAAKPIAVAAPAAPLVPAPTPTPIAIQAARPQVAATPRRSYQISIQTD